MDPQQELFTELLLKCRKKWGKDVYDGALPPDGTPYPFIYLSDSHQVDDPNKTAVFGNVFQTIHVWHNNPAERGTVSQIIGEVKSLCRHLDYTKSFAWDLRNVNQRILADSTMKQPLMHGVLEVEFKFCRR